MPFTTGNLKMCWLSSKPTWLIRWAAKFKARPASGPCITNSAFKLLLDQSTPISMTQLDLKC
eukprot:1159802-Pelagomonas_calceolata.AAC.1